MNADFMSELFETWKRNPGAVDASWHAIFQQLDRATPDRALLEAFERPTRVAPDSERVRSSAFAQDRELVSQKDIVDSLKIGWMIRAYEVRGHLIAELDPLGMFAADLSDVIPQELEHTYFGFSEADMDRKFALGVIPRLGGFHGQTERVSLRELIAKLRSKYCGKVGWEYMHIVDGHKTVWLRNRIHTQPDLTTDEKKYALENLSIAESFEVFLHTKYSTTKRFGLDGAETLIPMLNLIVDHAAQNGVEHFVIGMAHRGRLNVLANVCGKDYGKILLEFEGKTMNANDDNASGDVKYHLGVALNRITRSGKKIRINLVANPSHLEAVNPIVSGKVRAKQHYIADRERRRVMAILIHGDAAFSGQGVCYETMGLGDLQFYEIGGTIHLIVNNQIGFTTNPNQSRSAPYCSELAKPVQAPVFHVNADEPEQALRAAKIAVDWRNQWKKDVVIDMVCYRRYGHNETDEPSFTQPLMYQKIKAHPTTLQIYTKKLIADGVVTSEEATSLAERTKDKLKSKLELAKSEQSSIQDWKENEWQSYTNPLQIAMLKNTSVPKEILQEIGAKITTIPEGFEPHPTLRRIIKERGTNYADGVNIDWGSAEALAFGSLLLEGNHVRVSGQDVERGTFSQRHAVLLDVTNAKLHIPLAHMHAAQAGFRIINSSLSEFGVCGYELGYSAENPASLVVWEAQFGDFSNGAQVVYDQFLSTMEQKWLRQVGLVVNLPHGYDGMGPEHSSGRIERFLQSSDDHEEPPMELLNFAQGKTLEELYGINEQLIQKRNWQVCFPSTPANYFHVLRRQIHRPFRKPLILFFSKAFLRTPNVSTLEEMSTGTHFHPVLDDPTVTDPAKVKEILFCSGQVYFHLAKRKEALLRDDIAIVRLEQISPFPWVHVDAILRRYPTTAKLLWVQEEPRNMGSWLFVRARVHNLLRGLKQERKLTYVGRSPSAATATGSKALHDTEVQMYLEKAVGPLP